MYNDLFKKQCRKTPVAISSTALEDTAPHIHKEFEMIYVAKGKTYGKTAMESYTASKGDIILANPMEVHSLTIDKEEEYFHHCICFDTSLISDTTMAEALAEGTMYAQHIIKSDHPSSAIIRDLFLKLFKVAEDDGETAPLEAGAYISLIFAEIVKADLISKVIKRNKQSVFCSKIIKYINENYSKSITSAEPAKEFFYTQSHFCRTFTQNFGTSFSVFLNMYRVARAKEMLENTYTKISDIAQNCGFENLSYFSKTFKKIVGLSPAEYKKYQYSTKTPSKE
ncbi:MAG: AraC family transcriptional regulator [Clostridia bacterium]|nr:AraC family transcriptional regulator [Clostridia bacterium]